MTTTLNPRLFNQEKTMAMTKENDQINDNLPGPSGKNATNIYGDRLRHLSEARPTIKSTKSNNTSRAAAASAISDRELVTRPGSGSNIIDVVDTCLEIVHGGGTKQPIADKVKATVERSKEATEVKESDNHPPRRTRSRSPPRRDVQIPEAKDGWLEKKKYRDLLADESDEDSEGSGMDLSNSLRGLMRCHGISDSHGSTSQRTHLSKSSLRRTASEDSPVVSTVNIKRSISTGSHDLTPVACRSSRSPTRRQLCKTKSGSETIRALRRSRSLKAANEKLPTGVKRSSSGGDIDDKDEGTIQGPIRRGLHSGSPESSVSRSTSRRGLPSKTESSRQTDRSKSPRKRHSNEDVPSKTNNNSGDGKDGQEQRRRRVRENRLDKDKPNGDEKTRSLVQPSVGTDDDATVPQKGLTRTVSAVGPRRPLSRSLMRCNSETHTRDEDDKRSRNRREDVKRPTGRKTAGRNRGEDNLESKTAARVPDDLTQSCHGARRKPRRRRTNEERSEGDLSQDESSKREDQDRRARRGHRKGESQGRGTSPTRPQTTRKHQNDIARNQFANMVNYQQEVLAREEEETVEDEQPVEEEEEESVTEDIVEAQEGDSGKKKNLFSSAFGVAAKTAKLGVIVATKTSQIGASVATTASKTGVNLASTAVKTVTDLGKSSHHARKLKADHTSEFQDNNWGRSIDALAGGVLCDSSAFMHACDDDDDDDDDDGFADESYEEQPLEGENLPKK